MEMASDRTLLTTKDFIPTMTSPLARRKASSEINWTQVETDEFVLVHVEVLDPLLEKLHSFVFFRGK